MVVYESSLRTCFGLQGYSPPRLIKDRQRPWPVTEGSDHKIRTIQQRDGRLVTHVETMQLQARLRRPPSDTTRLHDELSRVQPESAQTKHTPTKWTDVLRSKFRISVCKG